MREEINNRQEIESEIDLQEMLFSYLHHAWVIVLCVVAFIGIALAYTKIFVTPMYRSSVTIYVNNSINNANLEYIASSDLSVSQKLVDTYVAIIKSDRVLEEVKDVLDRTWEEGEPTYSAARLRSMISAEQVEATEVFTVSVSNANRKMAAKVANTIADVAPDEIASIVRGSSTEIIDWAKVAGAPYTPDYTKNALIGALIGLVLSVVYLTIRYLLDVHINDAEDLERMCEYPVLGQIPDIMQVRNRTRGAYAKYAEEAEENERKAKAKRKSDRTVTGG